MKRTKDIFLGVAAGVLSVIFSVAAGLGFIHLFDWLYRIDIRLLDIPGGSGLSEGVILRNYHAVMKFLSPFSSRPFTLPDLSYSQGGAQHFIDCKAVFNGVYLAGLASLLLLLVIVFTVNPRRDNGSLRAKRIWRVSGITALALPLAVLCAVAIDFEWAFIFFHKVFFSNDLWLFNYVTDPVINILPAGFFMHCAVVIAAFIIITAAAQLALSAGSHEKASHKQ